MTFRKHTPESTERVIEKGITPQWGTRLTVQRSSPTRAGGVKVYPKEVIDLVNEYNRVRDELDTLREWIVENEAKRATLEDKLRRVGFTINS